jgi:hypothetical protein
MKEVFTKIADKEHVAMSNVEEHIQIIAEILKYYKKEIEELKEKLTTTTPPEVIAKREKHATLEIEIIEREVKKVKKKFDRTTQTMDNVGGRRKVPTTRPIRG